MLRITPQHLLWALGEGNVVNRIFVDERTRHHGRVALDRMLSLR
jgi:quinolinate synthase